MEVKNATGNRILDKKAVLCSNAFSKFLGMMFSKQQERALIFRFNKEKTISLHMLFVFYPIDVIFLDKNKIVVDKKGTIRHISLSVPGNMHDKKLFDQSGVHLPDTAKGDLGYLGTNIAIPFKSSKLHSLTKW
jgi:uncharacterized membrane protein (UPF0127 family)